MSGTLQFDMPSSLADYSDNSKVDIADYTQWRKGGSLANEVDNPGTNNAADYTAWRERFGNNGEVEPNFCFCWYNSTDTRHRVGLGLSNVVETGFIAKGDSLRVDLFYASSAGNGFVFATKDGTQDQNNNNSRVPDGTYSFVFDYVPGNDPQSLDTTGSSMSATITDGTNTWFATKAPLANAPWALDGFGLDNFGVIIRTTSGAVRNGIFNFTISNVSYTGGTAVSAPSLDGASVPEPASALLMLLAGLAVMMGGRQRV
jgi:hypothetical protein